MAEYSKTFSYRPVSRGHLVCSDLSGIHQKHLVWSEMNVNVLRSRLAKFLGKDSLVVKYRVVI